MNNKQLMEVSKKSETASNILSFVSERQRNTVYTAFSGLRADMKKKFGKAVNRREFDATFAELESIGAGTVEKSPRGVFQGFTWSVPIRKIATLIRNSDEVGKPVAPTVLEAPQVEEGTSTNGLRRKVTLVIIRRNGQPQTIVTDEKAIQSLAM